MSTEPAVSRRLRGFPLDDVTRARLCRLIEREGVPATSRRLRIAASALGRAAGGLPVQRGTALLILVGLRDAEPSAVEEAH
jgi:hypothetical protein